MMSRKHVLGFGGTKPLRLKRMMLQQCLRCEDLPQQLPNLPLSLAISSSFASPLLQRWAQTPLSCHPSLPQSARQSHYSPLQVVISQGQKRKLWMTSPSKKYVQCLLTNWHLLHAILLRYLTCSTDVSSNHYQGLRLGARHYWGTMKFESKVHVWQEHICHNLRLFASAQEQLQPTWTSLEAIRWEACG